MGTLAIFQTISTLLRERAKTTDGYRFVTGLVPDALPRAGMIFSNPRFIVERRVVDNEVTRPRPSRRCRSSGLALR